MTETQISNRLREVLTSGAEDFSVASIWAGGVVAIISGAGQPPGLFFQVLDDSHPSQNIDSVQGLTVSRHLLSVNDQNVPGLLLKPSEHEYLETFLSLADHLFDRLSFQADVSGTSMEILELIDEWIRFWKTNGGKPSRELVLGLIGELLTMTQLIRLSGLGHLNWEGPSGGNHDFRIQSNAIEVKVCGSRAGGLVHKISTQRQLEIPENGSLHLHSLRIQLGPNLGHRLDDLLREASRCELFNSIEGRQYFDKAIRMVLPNGEVPDEISTFDVLEQNLFRVGGQFPKILADDLMVGVQDVHYSIDLTSLVADDTRVGNRKFDMLQAKWGD